MTQVLPSTSEAQAQQTLPVLNMHRDLKRKRRRSRQEIVLFERIRRELNAAWDMMRDRIDAVVTSSGANELAPAMEAGLLEIDILLSGRDDFSLEDMLQEFLDRLAKALSNDAAYPCSMTKLVLLWRPMWLRG